MIYLLKFGASFFLLPGIVFVLAWVLSIYLWRKKLKRVAIVTTLITAIMYLLSTELVAGYMMRSLESVYIQPQVITKGDVIVVLGSGATSDTPNMGEKGNLTSTATSRLFTGYKLYKKLHVPIVVSGGRVYQDSGDEADISKRELLLLGVPAEDIIVENRSLNTRQNSVYTAEILRDRGYKEPILVTSAFHMERSVLNFQKEGIEVLPYPTDYRTSKNSIFHFNKLMANADCLYTTNMVLKEKLRTFVTRYFE